MSNEKGVEKEVVFEGEICKVKQIDRRILEELRKKLEIKIENVDIISDAEIGKVLSIIEEKRYISIISWGFYIKRAKYK